MIAVILDGNWVHDVWVNDLVSTLVVLNPLCAALGDQKLGMALLLTHELVVDLGVAGAAILQEGLDDAVDRGVMVIDFLGNLVDRHLVHGTHEDDVDASVVGQDAVLVGHVARSVGPVLGVIHNLALALGLLPQVKVLQVVFAELDVNTRKLVVFQIGNNDLVQWSLLSRAHLLDLSRSISKGHDSLVAKDR